MENLETDTETADPEYALQAARLLLHSFPNQPHDPETFLGQLIIVLTGKPKTLLWRMNHPVEGFIAVEQFPTIASLNKWFDRRLPRFQPPPEHRKLLSAPPEPEVSLEVRAARVEKLRQIAEKMRTERRREDARRFGVKPLTFKHVHLPERLIEALAGGREMVGPPPKNEEDAA